MHQVPQQEPLFDISPDEVSTHFFYVTFAAYPVARAALVKTGMSKDVEKRMARDGQFKGHKLLWKRPCGCTPRIVLGRKNCEREIAWANAHAIDRQPASELYELSADVYTALRFMVGRDPRAMAALDWLRKHGMPSVG